MSQLHHISVCICTYKRPEMLMALLSGLEKQETGGYFSYSVVIVDNDICESARQVVEKYVMQSNISLSYHVVPKQNIASARNKAIENSKGDYVACIDDDELPTTYWLLNLYSACTRYSADGVLGPVKPYFEENSPAWIEKSKLCERRSFPTGTVMRACNTRTGNVLLKRVIFDDSDNRFDLQFGRTGGEDVWFFLKVIEKGYVFVWCNEAPVYEIVSSERWKASYYFKRSIRLGGNTGQEVSEKGLPGRSITIVIASFCINSLILLPAIFFGKHTFMRFLDKCTYNLSYIFGYFGLVIIKNRD